MLARCWASVVDVVGRTSNINIKPTLVDRIVLAVELNECWVNVARFSATLAKRKSSMEPTSHVAWGMVEYLFLDHRKISYSSFH